MIHNPTSYKGYSGLTIILDKPSRFDLDTGKLISGWAGSNFESFLYPINRTECQIRTLDEQSSLLENTKSILGLGDGCIGTLCSKDLTLNEIRGYPLNYQGIPLILSYAPQDAYDRKDYGDKDDLGLDSGIDDNIKGHGKTRRRNRRWWMMQDIKRSVYLAKFGIVPETKKRNVIIAGSQFWLFNNLNNLKNSYLYLDIEIDKNKNLTCIGLGYINSDTNEEEVFVYPWKTFRNELFYPEAHNRTFIQTLITAMNNNTVVVHNGMFDLFILAYFYKIPFPKKVIDTMLCWHRLYPELEKSLGHLLSYLTWLPYHKSEGIFDTHSYNQDGQLWEYNSKDIIAMMELLPRLLKELKEADAEKSAMFACSMIRPYLTMMYKGMKLDTSKMVERYNSLSLKRDQLDRCLRIVTNVNLNPRSPKQVAKYLYTKAGLNNICLNDREPTNEKTLLKTLVLRDETIPSIRLILASRGIGKTASSLKYNLYDNKFDNFSNNYQNLDFDQHYNRLTTAYNLAGTDTFRLSSRALLKFKTDKGFGTNVQNIDKNQRDLVIADDGKILIQIDQAGAEALIVAYLCRKGAYRDLFECGIKVHSFVALHVFKDKWKECFPPSIIDELCKLSPKELKKHENYKSVFNTIKESDYWPAKERYYFIAKMICHASNYNMKAPTFQLNVLQKSDGAINLTIKQCNEFLGLYHLLFPEIREWHASIIRELKATRVLRNLFGEPRRFLEQEGEDLWKQGFAFIPQSTVGEITNRAVVKVQGLIEEHITLKHHNKFDLLQNGHDSILSQSINQDDIIKDCVRYLKEAIEVWLISPFDGSSFQMKSEISIGKNWGPYKKDSNPEGIKEYLCQ